MLSRVWQHVVGDRVWTSRRETTMLDLRHQAATAAVAPSPSPVDEDHHPRPPLSLLRQAHLAAPGVVLRCCDSLALRAADDHGQATTTTTTMASVLPSPSLYGLPRATTLPSCDCALESVDKYGDLYHGVVHKLGHDNSIELLEHSRFLGYGRFERVEKEIKPSTAIGSLSSWRASPA